MANEEKGMLQVQNKTDAQGKVTAVSVSIGEASLQLTLPQAKTLAKTLVAMWEKW